MTAADAANARLIRAFSHMCGQVGTEVNCWRKEISADVPRQRRRWGSGGRGFKSPLPDQPPSPHPSLIHVNLVRVPSETDDQWTRAGADAGGMEVEEEAGGDAERIDGLAVCARDAEIEIGLRFGQLCFRDGRRLGVRVEVLSGGLDDLLPSLRTELVVREVDPNAAALIGHGARDDFVRRALKARARRCRRGWAGAAWRAVLQRQLRRRQYEVVANRRR